MKIQKITNYVDHLCNLLEKNLRIMRLAKATHPKQVFPLLNIWGFLGFHRLDRKNENGDEEVLQRNQGNEGKRGSGESRTGFYSQQRQEFFRQMVGKLPCQIHPNRFNRTGLSCLLWWDDLLVSRRPSWRAPSSRASATC